MLWIALPVAALTIVALTLAYVRVTLRWARDVTLHDRYFALPLAERRALKRRVQRRGAPLRAIARLESRLGLVRERPPTRYRGVVLPADVCHPDDARAALSYEPIEGDVFVATQMRCGTTWMQQIVYEVLSRGAGDLSDDGHRHMGALSPWIEASITVRLDDAPRIGRERVRIIKTHLPAALCPYAAAAKYIYVTRHPVACFASCLDFRRHHAGSLAPSRDRMLDWFCTDTMSFGPWPDHVAGWWDWSVTRPNVLFVHYEEAVEDLGACVDRVAAFLGVSLTEHERREVVRKSGFEHMKAEEEQFEMAPPHPLTPVGGTFFRSGQKERARELDPRAGERVRAFCRARLEGRDYPLARFYPDV